jgi:hypothetical protein
MGAAARNIMSKRHTQLLAVVGEDLRVVCAAWDGYVVVLPPCDVVDFETAYNILLSII